MAKAKKALAFFLVFAMFTCSFLSVSAQTPDAAENPPLELTGCCKCRGNEFKQCNC